MIQDPYKVLGVSENCSDEELKKAYRDLSKKYHPDANPDNPQAAEEKFKEVQEAYRQIVDARERGGSAYGSAGGNGQQGSYGYGGFEGFDDIFGRWGSGQQEQSADETIEMQAARNYINSGHYAEAMNALNQTTEMNRNARWYYYASIASQGQGSNVDAMNYAKRACDMDPDNGQYQQLLRQLQSGGSWYEMRGDNFGGFNPVSNPAGWCLGMLALNVLCNLCFCL